AKRRVVLDGIARLAVVLGRARGEIVRQASGALLELALRLGDREVHAGRTVARTLMPSHREPRPTAVAPTGFELFTVRWGSGPWGGGVGVWQIAAGAAGPGEAPQRGNVAYTLGCVTAKEAPMSCLRWLVLIAIAASTTAHTASQGRAATPATV